MVEPSSSESNIPAASTAERRRESTALTDVNESSSAKDGANPAADARQMRRIIAEDPEWNLMTVPMLSDLCVRSIVTHFHTHPRHDHLPLKYRKKVLKQISTHLPLAITSSLIESEDYWQRCCLAKWRVNDVSLYGDSWKRMFFEREVKFIVENFVPNRTDPSKLEEMIQLGANYIRKLDIKQLLPPVELERKPLNPEREEGDNDDDDDDGDNDKEDAAANDSVSSDHFDFLSIVPKLPHLAELHVNYGVRDCGMNFEWQLFDFTKKDCQNLATCVKQCHTLRSLHINWSKMDDNKIRLFIAQILDHPTLVELDLAHNLISDRGSRAIGKFLNGHSRIETLQLCNNQIRANGAQAIAHSLIKNTTIKSLDLRLNRLGDEGGQAIAKSLLRNVSLTRINLASNNMTEPTAAIISSVISQNKQLRYLDLSSNRLGPDGGKQIQDAMHENTSLIELDLRLTECGQESDFVINQILKTNYENDRNARIDEQDKLHRSLQRTFSHIF